MYSIVFIESDDRAGGNRLAAPVLAGPVFLKLKV